MGKNKTTSLKLHVPDASREMIKQCEKLVHNYTGNMTTTTVCEDGRDSGGTFLAGISMVTSKSSVDMTISLEEKPAIYLLEKVLDIPADGEDADVKLYEDEKTVADLAALLYMLKGNMLPSVLPLYERLFEKLYTHKDEDNTLNLISLSRVRDFLEDAENVHAMIGDLPGANEFSEMILKHAEEIEKTAAEKPSADQQQEPEKEATAPTPESGAEPPKPKKRGRPRKNPAPEAPAPGSEAKPATETVAEAVALDTTPATDQQQEPEKTDNPTWAQVEAEARKIGTKKDAENGNNV